MGTPDVTADFVVQTFNLTIYEGNVTSNNPAVIGIPSQLIVTGSGYDNRHKGIHIFSSGDGQIFVLAETLFAYILIGYGAFLAYPDPRESLGNVNSEYEYIIMSTDSPLVGESVFLLAAFDNNTTIMILPSQTILVPDDLQAQNYTIITLARGLLSQEFVLNRGQTLLISGLNDLTGTKIIANKPLSVISGHTCAHIPPGFDCEPLAVQIPPVATWGTKFLLAPYAEGNDPQIFRAIASNDTSIVVSCGNSSTVTAFTLNSIYTFATSNYCYIESGGPIFLVQLSTSGSEDIQGNVAISIVAPIDQYINEIEFFDIPFPTSYISVTVPAEHYGPDNFHLDGTTLNCIWQEIYNSTRNIVGYGCSKNLTSGNLSTIQHSIRHLFPNGSISVTTYGFFHDAGFAFLTGQQLKITEGKI